MRNEAADGILGGVATVAGSKSELLVVTVHSTIMSVLRCLVTMICRNFLGSFLLFLLRSNSRCLTVFAVSFCNRFHRDLSLFPVSLFLRFPSSLLSPSPRVLSVCFVKESSLVVPQVTSSRHLLADLFLLQQLSTKLTHLIYCGVQDIALLHQ